MLLPRCLVWVYLTSETQLPGFVLVVQEMEDNSVSWALLWELRILNVENFSLTAKVFKTVLRLTHAPLRY